MTGYRQTSETRAHKSAVTRKEKRHEILVTPRQAAIYDFIQIWFMRFGYSPSIRDIGEAVGLSSPSTVFSHLRTLEQRGLIERNPSQPRSIRLVVAPTPAPSFARAVELLTQALPVVAAVTSGLADEIETFLGGV